MEYSFFFFFLPQRKRIELLIRIYWYLLFNLKPKDFSENFNSISIFSSHIWHSQLLNINFHGLLIVKFSYRTDDKDNYFTREYFSKRLPNFTKNFQSRNIFEILSRDIFTAGKTSFAAVCSIVPVNLFPTSLRLSTTNTRNSRRVTRVSWCFHTR